jgi:DNA-binding transcriptional MerR regulator
MPKPKRDVDALTTAQVATMLGVPKSTLNFWLRTGRLVGPPPDATNGYRIWRPGDVEMLRRIIESEQLGDLTK